MEQEITEQITAANGGKPPRLSSNVGPNKNTMGAGKILSFYFSAGFTLPIAGATVWLSWLVYRRRKESGFLLLAIAVALQLLGLLVGRIVFSPVTIVEYPVKEWLMPLAFYSPTVASIITLVGWFLLSRKKREPNQGTTDNAGAAPRRV